MNYFCRLTLAFITKLQKFAFIQAFVRGVAFGDFEFEFQKTWDPNFFRNLHTAISFADSKRFWTID